jgi:2-amino-4-hydroxy-6-hydroxymethyldihydropteridine diphosphokinase
MEQVWIALGSNIGDRMGHLSQALVALERIAQQTAGRCFAVSHAYESEPVGYADQPWFLNAVAGLEVGGAESPEHLLESLLAIERAMGRRRGEIPKGPRQIDLDIIFYGNRVIDLPALRIPHPEMHRRRFVLAPLAEVAPDARHPVLRQSVGQMLAGLVDAHVVRRFGPLGADPLHRSKPNASLPGAPEE